MLLNSYPPHIPYGNINPINTALLQNEAAIRNSNTIFSTMVCPKCGERLIFKKHTPDRCTASCPKDCDYRIGLSIEEIITILNNNGLNWLVTPAKRSDYPTGKTDPSEHSEENKQCEDIPPLTDLKLSRQRIRKCKGV